MWTVFARIILRNRLAILIVTGIITVIMAYLALKVELTYNGTRILPADDSTYIEYEAFKSQFGEDGSVMAVGIQSDKLFQKDVFDAWYDLGQNVSKIKGVQSMLSITQLQNLVKDTTEGVFKFRKIMDKRPGSQAEVDSIKGEIYNMPFELNSVSKRILREITVTTLPEISPSEITVSSPRQTQIYPSHPIVPIQDNWSWGTKRTSLFSM